MSVTQSQDSKVATDCSAESDDLTIFGHVTKL